MFFCEFCEISKNTFFTEHLRAIVSGYLNGNIAKRPGFLEFRFKTSCCIPFSLRGHSHVETSHSLRQNDAKFQTHPPSTLHVKMPNLPKIDDYDFRYRISVVILMKFFLLSNKCINKCINKYII